MAMRDWVAKLDDFLKLSDRELLSHAGTVSRGDALAESEAQAQHKNGGGMIGGRHRDPRRKIGRNATLQSSDAFCWYSRSPG